MNINQIMGSIAGFGVFWLLVLFLIVSDAHAIAAFPGAEGGGAVSVGGRGGVVILVTNTNNGGVGSLRACVERSGPRTCVFRVGGQINLASSLFVRNPFLTIAGQTAPGGGITLAGKSMAQTIMPILDTNNIIIRYIRLRKGYNGGCPGECGSGIVMNGSNRIMLDHLTQTWNQDEGIAAGGRVTNMVTSSYTLLGEAVGTSTERHSTSYAFFGKDPPNTVKITDIDMHHNLTMNNANRNPLLRGRSTRLVNNLWYNLGSGVQASGSVSVDVILNKYKTGPVGAPQATVGAFIGHPERSPPGPPSIYMLGNIGWGQTSAPADQFSLSRRISGETGTGGVAMPVEWRRGTPLATQTHPITTEAVTSLEASILPIVGASRRLDCQGKWVLNRDSHDTKMVNQYINGTGPNRFHVIAEGEGFYGTYPIIAPGTACPDDDNDGMPNAYEVIKGFNPNVANNNTIGAGGFTQLELFLAGEDGGVTPPEPPDPTVNKFVNGNRVFVTSSTINVRATASAPAGTLLGTQPMNAQGVVIGGPTQTTSGVIWYNINFDTGVDGWVGEGNIALVMNSDTPPSVVITAPINGAVVSGAAFEIKGTATDNTAVTGYQLKLDGVNLGTEDISGSSSYSFMWNTTLVSNGPHVLTAVARDGAGNATTTLPVNVTVSNSTGGGIALGEANILSTNALITANIVNSQAFTLSQRATVQSMTMFIQATTGNIEMGVYDDDGAAGKPGTLLANTAAGLPGGTGWRTLSIVTPVVLNPGVYWLAFQTDGGVTLKSEITGGVNSRDTHIFGSLPNPHVESSTNTHRHSFFANLTPDVDGTSPTVALTAPAAGNVSGAAVAVTATASDAGGVAGVSFHAVPPNESPTATNIIGVEDTTSTYGVTWDTTALVNGPYTLFAVARDVAGNKAGVGIAVTVANGGLAVPSGLGVVREAP